MPLALQVDVRVVWAVGGTGSTFVEQAQAAVAGQGQISSVNPGIGFVGTGLPHAARVAQSRSFYDFEAIPVAAGSEANVTLANINTALTNAVFALAGPTGTPLITPAELAIIAGWASGGT